MLKLIILAILPACSLMFNSDQPASARGSQYSVKFQSDKWNQQKNDERSDYVWLNKNNGRVLLSNSFCNEFQDQPLDHLASNTFRMVSGLEIEKQDYTTFHNREAYRLEGRGKVDGVPVGLILLNTRRNNCYFDFVSISPEGSSKEEVIEEDFKALLDSVEFK